MDEQIVDGDVDGAGRAPARGQDGTKGSAPAAARELAVAVHSVVNAQAEPLRSKSQAFDILMQVRRRCPSGCSYDQRLNTFLLLTSDLLDRCRDRDRPELERAMVWLARDLLIVNVDAVERSEAKFAALSATNEPAAVDVARDARGKLGLIG